MISLDDLDAVKASDVPYEFEFKFGNGKPSGIFISVLGEESETVTIETAALLAAERSRAASLGDAYVQDNVKLGKHLAAIRIVGWKGIKEEYSKENALKLCMGNTGIADAVITNSKNLANFIKL
jgi:hypothetical protein